MHQMHLVLLTKVLKIETFRTEHKDLKESFFLSQSKLESLVNTALEETTKLTLTCSKSAVKTVSVDYGLS